MQLDCFFSFRGAIADCTNSVSIAVHLSLIYRRYNVFSIDIFALTEICELRKRIVLADGEDFILEKE